MKISIVKMTPSKKNPKIVFVDVVIESLSLRFKGLKAVQSHGTMSIYLPTLDFVKDEKKCRYSPLTFSTKEAHDSFINSVKEQLIKLLNIGAPKK